MKIRPPRSAQGASVLFLALALVVAGCAGATVTPSPTPTASPSPTVTPTPTPAPTLTSDDLKIESIIKDGAAQVISDATTIQNPSNSSADLLADYQQLNQFAAGQIALSSVYTASICTSQAWTLYTAGTTALQTWTGEFVAALQGGNIGAMPAGSQDTGAYSIGQAVTALKSGPCSPQNPSEAPSAGPSSAASSFVGQGYEVTLPADGQAWTHTFYPVAGSSYAYDSWDSADGHGYIDVVELASIFTSIDYVMTAVRSKNESTDTVVSEQAVSIQGTGDAKELWGTRALAWGTEPFSRAGIFTEGKAFYLSEQGLPVAAMTEMVQTFRLTAPTPGATGNLAELGQTYVADLVLVNATWTAWLKSAGPGGNHPNAGDSGALAIATDGLGSNGLVQLNPNDGSALSTAISALTTELASLTQIANTAGTDPSVGYLVYFEAQKVQAAGVVVRRLLNLPVAPADALL